MSDTSKAYFFGYGSLVNRDTHDYAGAQTARLRGWRRIWRYTTQRQVAYLTVVPDPEADIDGLILPVPAQDWAALDHRERAYARVPVADQTDHNLAHRPDIAVFAIPDGQHVQPQGDHALLLSYIDVVVQGYLREFGSDGVTRFFTSTHGWNAPVIDDRAQPRYPRHCLLSVQERALVDQHLCALGVVPATEGTHLSPWRE